MAEDPLLQVDCSSFDKVLKNLEKFHPDSLPISLALKTAIRWKDDDPRIMCQLFTTEGSEDDGTSVLIAGPILGLQISLFSRNADKLISAVDTTTKIPWHLKPKFARLEEHLVKPILATLQPKGECSELSELIEMFWLPGSQALALPDLPLPDGVLFRDVVLGDAQAIADTWQYGGKHAQKFISDFIRFNSGIGAVDAQGQLLGWALWGICGGLAHVFVYPTYRRRGLARLLVTAMAKRIARHGSDVTANVAARNETMVHLLKSLGFQHLFYDRFVHVIFNSPSAENT